MKEGPCGDGFAEFLPQHHRVRNRRVSLVLRDMCVITRTSCFCLFSFFAQIRRKHPLQAELVLCHGASSGEQNPEIVPRGGCTPYWDGQQGRKIWAGF